MLTNATYALPFLLTVITALALLVYEAARGKKRNPAVTAAIAGGGLAVALYNTLLLYNKTLINPVQGICYGQLAPDAFGYFAAAVVLAGALLTVFVSEVQAQRRELVEREFYGLLTLSTSGLVLLALSNCYLTLLFGLEIASLALYALAGLAVRDDRSREAAFKYFLMGAFASALLVFGVALIFAQQGSFLFAETAKLAANVQLVSPGLFIGLALILAGMFFKISVVPFHSWTPDAYEGAPTPVTAFMSVAVKAAGVAIIFRLLFVAFRPLAGDYISVLAGLALLTMTLANFTALAQERVKRLLAWSTVSHVGYLLVGFTAVAAGAKHVGADQSGAGSGLLFYLVAYTLMNVGAFAVVMAFEKSDEPLLTTDLNGIATRHPLLAAALSVFLLSLAGIPPLAGFMGKFTLLYGAAKAGFLGLALVGVINSLISVYYYLRIIFAMYAGKDAGREAAYNLPQGIAITFAVMGVLYLGIMPGGLLTLAKLAILRSF